MVVDLEMNSVEGNLEDGVQYLIRKINQSVYIKKSNFVSYLDKINSLYLLTQY